MGQFFVKNLTIITFGQGLVFFALGFAVWLQRRRTTRLRLSSELIWLAAFAFFESIAIWGYAFVPIQATYLDADIVDVLMVVRTVIQVAAFLFLLEFGLRLLAVSRAKRRLLSAIGISFAGAAAIGSGVVARSLGWSLLEWEQSTIAATRYAILLPGALLSAVGIWRQGSELVIAGMRRIRPYADAAAWVLVVYALVAGLVVDAAPWAPPWLASEGGWLPTVGFPLRAVRAGAGLALLALAIKLLEIFDVESQQRIAGLERARLVAEERARFGRDLHDGTIQSLYAAGLQLESVAMQSGDGRVRRGVREVVTQLNAAIVGIRGYINALHRPPESAESIAARLDATARGFACDNGLDVRVTVRGTCDAGLLPDEAGHHTEQILREALSNAARHSGAQVAAVEITFTVDEFDVVVTDDGCGLDLDAPTGGGRGLANMSDRARRLGGRLSIDSADGTGTRVTLAVPLDGPPEPPDRLTFHGRAVPTAGDLEATR